MLVAYVLKRFPRLSETFVVAELLELGRQGQDVHVFAISRPAEPFTHGFLADLDVPVTYLPHRPLRQPVRVARAVAAAVARHPRGWFRTARSALWPPSVARARKLLQATVLLSEMRAAGAHHAHAHFATSAARLAGLAARMGGPPYSVTAHAKDIWHDAVRPDDLREALGPARFVATVSEANRAYLSAVLGGATDVCLVPNSVDTRRLAPAVGAVAPRRVLTVARLVEKKGIGDLVDACRLLDRRGRAVDLEVVGDGPERACLEAAAARAGIEVRFAGALPHEDVVERYRRAAVFCLPCVVASDGDRDGLPTAVLEAMALGVPVVTTSVNGLADAVVDGCTGLVVPERDPKALADALDRVLSDPELAGRLAAAARRRVEERFSLHGSVALLRRRLVGAP